MRYDKFDAMKAGYKVDEPMKGIDEDSRDVV